MHRSGISGSSHNEATHIGFGASMVVRRTELCSTVDSPEERQSQYTVSHAPTHVRQVLVG